MILFNGGEFLINYRKVLKSIGSLLIIEAACMVPSMLVSLFYKEKAVYSFAISIVITAIAGFILYRLKAPNQNIYARDGFAITALGWLSVTVFGALPFLISGSIPSVIDAFFETASGFTTTGASILREVESLPK